MRTSKTRPSNHARRRRVRASKKTWQTSTHRWATHNSQSSFLRKSQTHALCLLEDASSSSRAVSSCQTYHCRAWATWAKAWLLLPLAAATRSTAASQVFNTVSSLVARTTTLLHRGRGRECSAIISKIRGTVDGDDLIHLHLSALFHVHWNDAGDELIHLHLSALSYINKNGPSNDLLCLRVVLHVRKKGPAHELLHLSFFQNGPVDDPQCPCHEINRLNICCVSRKKSKGQSHLFGHLCKCRDGQNKCSILRVSGKAGTHSSVRRNVSKRKTYYGKVAGGKCAVSVSTCPKTASSTASAMLLHTIIQRSCRSDRGRRAVPVVQDLRDPSLTFGSCSDRDKQTAMSERVSCLRCLSLSASDVVPWGCPDTLEVVVCRHQEKSLSKVEWARCHTACCVGSIERNITMPLTRQSRCFRQSGYRTAVRVLVELTSAHLSFFSAYPQGINWARRSYIPTFCLLNCPCKLSPKHVSPTHFLSLSFSRASSCALRSSWCPPSLQPPAKCFTCILKSPVDLQHT